MFRNFFSIACNVGQLQNFLKRFPGACRTGSGNFKKAFLVFVTGTRKSTKLFRRFGREQEIKTIFPAVWELENHAFP